MGIVKRMQNLLEFFIGSRGSGSTTLLNKIAKENDVYVLVHKSEMKDYFDKEVSDKIYSPETLYKLRSAPKKPILIDNALFHEILTDALLDIGSKGEIIEHQKNTLSTIQEIIALSNKENPHKMKRFRVNSRTKYVTFL